MNEHKINKGQLRHGLSLSFTLSFTLSRLAFDCGRDSSAGKARTLVLISLLSVSCSAMQYSASLPGTSITASIVTDY